MISLSFHRCFGLVLFMFLYSLVGCAPTAAPAPTPAPLTTLDVSGSGTVTTILTSLKPAFERDTPTHLLNILTGSGTTGGVEGVVSGALDLAAMARTPRDEESAQGLQYVPFGNAAVAFIVHPDSENTTLTSDQAKGIFAGEIINWAEVGGADMPIVLFVRDEDESATIALRDAIFGDTAFPEGKVTVMTSAGDMVAAIEGTPGSIGFATWPGIVARKSSVVPVTLDGALPHEEVYPIITTLGLGFLETERPTVQILLDWLESDTGQSALQSLAILPVVTPS